jgi:8-oxo-dGTP diphosphatase
MARVSVLAAGGIVLRRQQPPLIAVVRLRKRDEWVLPKGKLDDGETPRAAAKREVLEETGHNVTVHEFLGTLAYDFGGRSKIVHYWRMEAGSEQAHELMHDVRAVDWLPLGAAVERLSRPHEQAFLANVGPQALASFAARRQKAKAPVTRKRRSQPAVVPETAPALPLRELPRAEPAPEPEFVEPVPEVAIAKPMPVPAQSDMTPEPSVMAETPPIAEGAVSEQPTSQAAVEADIVATPVETRFSATPVATSDDSGYDDASATSHRQRRSLAQKVRDWLSRAA